MYSSRSHIFSILIVVLITACEKEIQWTYQTDNTSSLVVDGIITNELKPQCIKLSLTSSIQNQGGLPASGAIIGISDGNSSVELFESPSEPGFYYSEAFQAVVEHSYRLTVTFNSGIYEAEAKAVPVTAPDTFDILPNEENDLFRFVFHEGSQPAMTEIYYNWSAIPDYCSAYGNCYAQETFYSLNNVDVNELFGAPKQIIYFPEGTIIIRKKYSLTEAHQEFVRSLLMETEWSGGIFDVQHGNIVTNLDNGALGFFAACMVVSDTIRVE